MNEEKLYRKALDEWGITAQLDMVIEEMSELTKVICKVKRKGLIEMGNKIIEETIDVEIMINQLKRICKDQLVKFPYRFTKAKEKKLKHLEDLLKK